MAFGNAVGEGFVNGSIIVANKVIVFGPGDGIFLYLGSPGAGTLIGSWASESGTDGYGNAYPAGLQIGEASGAQVALLPGSGGSASEVQFPVPSPALSNQPNIAASGGTPSEFLISGPALAASGDKDWVQIELISNNTAGTPAVCFFTYVNNAGTPNEIGNFTSSGWQFSAATVLGTLTVDGNLELGMGVPVNYPNSHISTVPTAAEFNAIVDTTNNLIALMISKGLIV